MTTKIIVLTMVLGAGFLPCYIWYYRGAVVTRRRRELGDIINNAAAAEYLNLFFPALRVTPASEKDVVLNHFDSFHNPEKYFLGVLTATLPILLGLGVLAGWTDAWLKDSANLVSGIPFVLLAAFMGGYVWSLYELISRGTNGDLIPANLIQISYRVIAAVPIGFAFSVLVMEEVAAFIAFAVSAFPVRDLKRLMRQRFLTQLDESPLSLGSESMGDLLAQTIQGLDSEKQARLEEIRIATTLDMAYADPIQLAVESGFEFRIVLDWIDQSVLALYVREKLPLLFPLGIRGGVEALQFYQEHYFGKKIVDGHQVVDYDNKFDPLIAAQKPEVVELAEILEVTPETVPWILSQVGEDPHITFINKLW